MTDRTHDRYCRASGRASDRAPRRVAVLLCAIAACGPAATGGAPERVGLSEDAGRPPGSEAVDSGAATVPTAPDASDGGPSDAGAPRLPPSILPVTYQRADKGTPLTATQLQAATDELITLLKETRYFDFLDERVHGWPKTDPNGGYWWGTYWYGTVNVTKASGTVTYQHPSHGSHNSGIPSSPYIEGACYAHLLWGEPKTADLVRRMARGMSAWAVAMERAYGDTSPRMLSRSFYPPSVTSNEGGRSLFIDRSQCRPGLDHWEMSQFIHHPNNPTLGDIYVMNRRSKDDIGHMLRAAAQVQACAPILDPAAQADVKQLDSLYAAWAAEVDSRNFVIPTRDAAGNVYVPDAQLAHYSAAECPSKMAVRLAHASGPGNLDCGTGLIPLESTTWPFLKDDARQIQRSHHAAAVLGAHRRLATTVGLDLLKGLGDRVSLDFANASTPINGFLPIEAAGFMIYAASVGVPLRSDEIRFLHARLHEAYVGMRDPKHFATFNLFDPSVPDGAYAYHAPNIGLFHHDLALMLGTCASPYRNPAGRPLLDCDRLLDAFKP